MLSSHKVASAVELQFPGKKRPVFHFLPYGYNGHFDQILTTFIIKKKRERDEKCLGHQLFKAWHAN